MAANLGSGPGKASPQTRTINCDLPRRGYNAVMTAYLQLAPHWELSSTDVSILRESPPIEKAACLTLAEYSLPRSTIEANGGSGGGGNTFLINC
jgi:hypothetical protein